MYWKPELVKEGYFLRITTAPIRVSPSQALLKTSLIEREALNNFIYPSGYKLWYTSQLHKVDMYEW